MAPDELLGEELLPEADPEALPLAPPEAEPDLEGSVALGELELGDELDELGELGEVEEELELEGGVERELPLVLPLVLLPADLPEPVSWPQAARPKAKATAAASVESFMCPPWLGIRKKAANNGPGPGH